MEPGIYEYNELIAKARDAGVDNPAYAVDRYLDTECGVTFQTLLDGRTKLTGFNRDVILKCETWIFIQGGQKKREQRKQERMTTEPKKKTLADVLTSKEWSGESQGIVCKFYQDQGIETLTLLRTRDEHAQKHPADIQALFDMLAVAMDKQLNPDGHAVEGEIVEEDAEEEADPKIGVTTAEDLATADSDATESQPATSTDSTDEECDQPHKDQPCWNCDWEPTETAKQEEPAPAAEPIAEQIKLVASGFGINEETGELKIPRWMQRLGWTDLPTGLDAADIKKRLDDCCRVVLEKKKRIAELKTNANAKWKRTIDSIPVYTKIGEILARSIKDQELKGKEKTIMCDEGRASFSQTGGYWEIDLDAVVAHLDRMSEEDFDKFCDDTPWVEVKTVVYEKGLHAALMKAGNQHELPGCLWVPPDPFGKFEIKSSVGGTTAKSKIVDEPEGDEQCEEQQ